MLAVPLALRVSVSTSAENKGKVPPSSESQPDSKVQTQNDSPSGESHTEQEVVEIPLENIWGHDRSLRGLEPELFIKRNSPEKRAEYSTPEKLQEIRDKAESSLAFQIERALNNEVMNENKKKYQKFNEQRPAPGFAVVGRDRRALPGIHKVVVGGEIPQQKFSTKDDISIVFFTLVTGVAPHLIHAESVGTMINLYYVLPANGRLGMKPCLYIIPIGKLSPGEYEVDLIRADQEESKFNAPGFESYAKGVESSFVCQPFRFEVLEKSPNGKGAK